MGPVGTEGGPVTLPQLLARMGISEPTIGELMASVERERLRDQGVLVWVAREASA